MALASSHNFGKWLCPSPGAHSLNTLHLLRAAQGPSRRQLVTAFLWVHLEGRLGRRGNQRKHQEWWKSFSLLGGGDGPWTTTLSKSGRRDESTWSHVWLVRNSSPAPKAPGIPLPPFIGSLPFYQTLLPFVPDQRLHSAYLCLESLAPAADFPLPHTTDSWSPTSACKGDPQRTGFASLMQAHV